MSEDNLHKMSVSVEIDKEKCIKCTKCVQRCQKCSVNYLKISGQGKERFMDFNEENPCIYCGQCTLVCPVNAIREQSNIVDVENLLKDKDKIKIVQIAPSVRTSINELFNLEHNINVEKKLNTALKLLGFDKVFDVNFGADITTIVEADELIERLENNNLPMFTSCCQSWVAYVEKYHPELKDNLTTARSPHIHSSIAYKTWWGSMNNVKAENISVISIMPCTSKKHEIELETSKFNGVKAVDYVLTVRELGTMLKNNNIDLKDLEETELDKYSEYSGASIIYGASGGVMESALRTAYEKITGNELENIEFNSVRTDSTGFNKAEIDINGKKINVAIVAGKENIEKILSELKKEPNKYQYIEVMNCLGGCINGGGQPKLPIRPTDEIELINKRRNVLYSIDNSKKIRKAHENTIVKEYFDWLDKDEKFKHIALHYK